MCGEHEKILLYGDAIPGSSPHVRGARGRTSFPSRFQGIIPACAGSTGRGSCAWCPPRDHPRMCGEHFIRLAYCNAFSGSSPHVRGAHDVLRLSAVNPGIIPACAGSTSANRNRYCFCGDHPRMCGEHGMIADDLDENGGSSPHVRGAHFENSIIPRKRKDNWLFFIQFRFENFLAFRYLLALLHPFLGVPTKDPSFASLGRLINCNPSQSTGDQSAPYTLKAICCSFLAE